MKPPCDQGISSVNSSLINVIFKNYPSSRQSHSKTPPQQYFTQLLILPMVTIFFFLKYFYILF